VVVLGVPGSLWWSSLLPSRYSGDGHGLRRHRRAARDRPGRRDGRACPAWRTGAASPRSPIRRPAQADVRVTLVARKERTRLASGQEIDGYTLNGTSPGPQITAVEGQLVEVRLQNASVPAGVVLHWHGVEVPGAMDGTAGVTQDAVPPGGEFVYRFRATHAGTFWYHSHQVTHEQVERGLFGALVITPRTPAAGVDALALVHLYEGPPHRQRPGGRRARHGAARHPGAGAGRQHRRGPHAGVADRRRVPGGRRRRSRGARAHPGARHVGGGHRGWTSRPGGARATAGRRRARRDRGELGDRARHAAAADPGARGEPWTC
jgi:FtsP/CotA-like multicopper oxidase with cupredoxin domain